ncbi:WG repeat-containing protein [Phnomibacter ginsenosidimutans]|uniref:WG repeat-containing protein n=1 Tax=Phnomibacter ginsenosidimutans TaxID=2676868 RepID=A0A6I6GBG1_9BACT|nr:WG repeat-containing protein [Phnomibacter ginsenosidimutans]QGW29033.1 hypothetical protein GLV81_13810 [Phnomibacter ginsenosidimutans]
MKTQPALAFSFTRLLRASMACCLLMAGTLEQPFAQSATPLLFVEQGKIGYKDVSGKTIIAPQFGMAGRFSEGLANAQMTGTGKFGFIGLKGEWKIKADFDAAGDFSEGMARVQQQGKWGYIDKTGQWKISPQFQLCYEFVQGFAIAQKAGKWGIIDKKGSWVLAPSFYDISTPANGWYSAKPTLSEPWKIFNMRQPPPAAGFSASKIKAFSTNGLAPARDAQDKWGIIDTTGAWVVAPQFSNLEPFAEGMAAAEKDFSSWGYIDSKGQWKIAPAYDRAGTFWKAAALVEKGNSISYINPNGQLLFSFSR